MRYAAPRRLPFTEMLVLIEKLHFPLYFDGVESNI